MEEGSIKSGGEELTILIEKKEGNAIRLKPVKIKREQEGGSEPPSPSAEETVEQYVIQNEFKVSEDGEQLSENSGYQNAESGSDLSDTEVSYRPVRPVERQKMRPWLFDLLDKANVPGLSWQNRSERIFRISWKHAAHNCFDRHTDSDLFERWAHHTGRRHEGNHKRWKANFRCALNSLPDVIELRDLGVRKGNNAFKVYKFIDLNDKKAKDKAKIYSASDGEFKGKEEWKGQQGQGQTVAGLRSRTSGSRQSATEPNSPSGQNILTGESGMLQTLLHAIELKNMEAARKDSECAGQDSEDDGARSTVKRSASAEKATLRIKRRKRESLKKKSQADTPVASDTESSSRSQDSSQFSVSSKPQTSKENTPVQSPTPGQNQQQFISMLPMKIPYLGINQVLVPCHVTKSKAKGEAGVMEIKRLGESLVGIPTTISITPNQLAAGQVSKTSVQTVVPLTVTSTSTVNTVTSTAATALQMKNISSLLAGQIIGINKGQSQQILQAQPVSLAPKVGTTTANVTGEKPKFEVTIPYTVIEALKSKQLALQDSTKMTVKEEERKDMTAGVRVALPVEGISSIPKMEVNKDMTSIAAALRMPMSQPIVPSLPVVTSSQAFSHTLTGTDIRSKLVSRLSSGSARPILVPSPGQHMVRPKLDKVVVQDLSQLLGANIGQIKIADASKLAKEQSSKSSPNSGIPPVFLGKEDQSNLGSTPSAVVQPVEQLSDIKVNINNVDDITYVGSGRSTPLQAPADAMETTDSSHPPSSCTPETRPDLLTEQVTINLDSVSNDHMSAEVVEEGIHITTQQSARRQGTSPSLPHILRTRSVMTQNNFSVTKNLYSNVNQSRSSTMEVTEGNVNGDVLAGVRKRTEDASTQCTPEKDVQNTSHMTPESSDVTKCNGKSEDSPIEQKNLRKILSEAIQIIKSSTEYRNLSFQVVDRGQECQFLTIRNDHYLGILGEDVDPFAAVLKQDGTLTTHVLFRVLQKEVLAKDDGELDQEKFISVLQKMTSYVLCPGLQMDKVTPGDLEDQSIVEFTQPFQRRQSKSCPVWHSHTEAADSAVPLQICKSCSELSEKKE